MDKRKNDDERPDRPWLSYLLIVLLVLVAVWIVLALMGPYIGNVYSNTGSLSR